MSYVEGIIPNRVAPLMPLSTHQTSKSGPPEAIEGTRVGFSITEPDSKKELPAGPCAGTKVNVPLSAPHSVTGVWAKTADGAQNIINSARQAEASAARRRILREDVLI